MRLQLVCFHVGTHHNQSRHLQRQTVVRGTRMTVQTVLEFLAAGDSVEDVLQEYPSLKRENIQACFDYASKLMANHYSVVSLA